MCCWPQPGRAAKVLSAYTNHPAWTIHKKIYRQKSGKDGLGEFVLDSNLHKNTYFIVDEASMIGDRSPDSFFGSGDLLRDLLDYVELGSQLQAHTGRGYGPASSCGTGYQSGTEHGKAGTFRIQVREIEMTDVVRQTQGSGILHNATSIRN